MAWIPSVTIWSHFTRFHHQKNKQSCFNCRSSSRMARTCIAINDIKSSGSHPCNPSLDSKDGIFARRLLCTGINSESMCRQKSLPLRQKQAHETCRTPWNFGFAEDFELAQAIAELLLESYCLPFGFLEFWRLASWLHGVALDNSLSMQAGQKMQAKKTISTASSTDTTAR